MLRRLLVSTLLAGSALVVPAVAAVPASAAVRVNAAATSCYRQAGTHWACVTPGAYCPKAARNKYGYTQGTNRRYKCSEYSNHQWRWKRA
ncbi:hypothetical protein ABZ815_52625 [Nonomuraea sp. NPDC047529]|uniref:hypothetical protein n=1 Tax=Nonomuraea sp. NPDC047529 TaxID=3155623 RepID=UPI0033CBA840